MSGHPSYPWSEGDALFASELNAAIANSAAHGPFLPTTGGIVSGPTEFHSTTDNALKIYTDFAGAANGVSGIYATTTNRGPHMTSGVRFDYASAGKEAGFDVAMSLIGIYDPILPATSGLAAYNAFWMVSQSPKDAVNPFVCLIGEMNVVNRGADTGWQRDRLGGPQLTGGLLMVPESIVFGGGANAGGEGKNATWAYSVARSGSNNSTGFPAKFYNGYWIEPNSIVGLTGRAAYWTGDITGTPSQYPYGPMQTDGTWLHGIDHTLAVYTDANAMTMLAGQGVAWLTGTTGTPTNICRDTAGSGSPEGVVTANKGSTYRRFDGGAATCFYVKESGTGNTGWVAK